VQKAANFVGLCIAGSEKAGTPVQEGVCLRSILRRCCKKGDGFFFYRRPTERII
jgi:hypothetical protein